MPTFAEQNLVMWRGYAHLVSLMDLLRLRTAGWVTQSLEEPEVHLGLVHAVQEYATPEEAARYLDVQAELARQRRAAARPRKERHGVWMHADPPRRGEADGEREGRVQTTRARQASRRASRRSARAA